MIISDVCIKRPVFASVISLLLIVFGVIAFDRLPLREYPDIDSPVVSIRTDYPGAAASVVESRITQLIEDRVAGLEGIKFISSSSRDGRSNIDIEFDLSRNIDSAANDVRDRVSRIIDNLPVEADAPDVEKVDSNDDVIMWLNLTSDRMTVPQLTDYAERYLVDRFSIVDGVARVRVGGGQSYAMRVWVDRIKLAAHQLTVSDIEKALRAENIELPAGSFESVERQFAVRLERVFVDPENFRQLVLKRGDNGHLVRLSDVATVVKGTQEYRLDFRGNGETMVGIGITKQSTANTMEVARAAKLAASRIEALLPEGMAIKQSYDTSVFIEEAVDEVYKTLAIAISLVIFIIFLFLGSVRAMLVPAVTVPVSLIATFIIIWVMGFTVNLLTLLALVLAIGLVVDDAIVVLENIHRRMEEYGESALVAAYQGTRQVGFAVIATTAVLIAVFAPIAVIEGDIGRLFSEFALTMSAAVFFSSLVALTLSPVIASLFLKPHSGKHTLTETVDKTFIRLRNRYRKSLDVSLRHPWYVVGAFALVVASSVWLVKLLPSEYVVKEDRGAFFVLVNGPEGTSYQYMKKYMDEIEKRLMPFHENGEAERILVRAPRSFGGTISNFNSGIVIVVLSPWDERRPANEIMKEVREKLTDLPGVTVATIMRQGIGGRVGKPVEFVLGGGSYEELAQWRDTLVEAIQQDNPGLISIDSDYKETSPQIRVVIDYQRAADLGVSVQNIGRTLESMLASRRVTTYIDNGEEYDVLIEGIRDQQNNPQDLANIYVRSENSGKLIPLASLVDFQEFAASQTLNRFNRTRAITIEADLDDNLSLDRALEYLEIKTRELLPEYAVIDYKGRSRDFKYSTESNIWLFGLGVVVMFLVLAAQFESYISPFIITLTVPLAMAGGLLGLYLTGNTLNLYSQIGLVMLIGLAAKNGILLVEFANQLRDEGKQVGDAIVEAAEIRLRPIVMTSITTIAGSIPLVVSSGAGSEAREVLGVTLFSGVLVATFFTLYLVPVAYRYLGKYTHSPHAKEKQLQQELSEDKM
ncbi:efflux RND transporter permease subunit [Teredinibacter sp. KSP-S5-2]|uniref:efflux RND transporter permease subunit n=1 Tax=Teredinibacter sp. KSP-S5-2 TaxID=3034506 RepID=UPI0029343D3E|nr:efflux RND transporter permease subunit [Teredinibacter sp. KSP-S5-2]WNO10767.1 efflux RND transporter permease subunit [Teredinibacter sp. KSP-S5-2]